MAIPFSACPASSNIMYQTSLKTSSCSPEAPTICKIQLSTLHIRNHSMLENLLFTTSHKKEFANTLQLLASKSGPSSSNALVKSPLPYSYAASASYNTKLKRLITSLRNFADQFESSYRSKIVINIILLS